MKNGNQYPNSKYIDSSYAMLYRIGAMAAFIAAILFRRNLDAELALFNSMGLFNIEPAVAPGNIRDWFTLLQQNQLLGLTLLNFFDLVNFALVGIIFLALIAALKKASPSWMLLVTALIFIGIAVYFATNQAFTMLALSKQYVATTSEAQRAMVMAAGESVLAIHQNNSFAGSGIYLSFLLVTIAGLITSIVMLRSGIFRKRVAKVGILANGFGLGYYMVLVISPALVFVPLSISAVFLLLWYLQIGLRLWGLGNTREAESVSPVGRIKNQKQISPLLDR